MKITAAAAMPAATTMGTTPGMPVLTVAGVDKDRGAAAPMTVFTRESVGRFDGYGSLTAALTAARNLSRGAERDALVVQRTATGAYEVRDAVWRYADATSLGPDAKAPFRHFAFEDGSFSAYTMWRTPAERVEVVAKDYYQSNDAITRWLVDGSRILEVTPEGGTGRV
ncbi:MAG: hypothetical protein JWM86_2390 [Thermoleophilia bacterium]|nr:hypothetical protein [Thermoleophilia bacterium]